MITQYRLELESNRPTDSGWGYRLYAALLERAQSDFCDRLHNGKITPVSQFLSAKDGKLLWTVNLLGEESEDALFFALETLEYLTLHRDGATVQVLSREVRRIADVDELFAQSSLLSGTHRLELCTPLAFKQNGNYTALPTARLLVQNLLRKWNGCILDCPIEDEDGQGLESLARGLSFSEFSLHSEKYPFKSTEITGCTGTLTIQNKLRGFQRELADALLCFADFSGIGIKTSLGMGGVRHF